MIIRYIMKERCLWTINIDLQEIYEEDDEDKDIDDIDKSYLCAVLFL